MRTFFILGSLFTASLMVANCGSDSVSCDESHTCAIEGDGSTPIDGSTGDGPVTPEGCDATADPKDSPKCVDDTFGVFVDATNGADTNSGTKLAPLKTINSALGKLSGKARVYVCAGAYPEHVKLTSVASIYGGFTCGTWAYDGSPASRAKVAPTDRGYALQLTTIPSAIFIEDLELAAQDGVDDGESSIAVFASDSPNVTLRRLTVTAGNGAGAKDADSAPTNLFSTQPTDLNGKVTTVAKGADHNVCDCKSYGKVTGAAGGDAGNPTAKKGDDGVAIPAPVVSGTRSGIGGVGFPASSGNCAPGNYGSDGSGRQGGTGAQAHGVLDANGWTPAAGTPGEAGNPGGGGGGGGGGPAVGGAGGGCGGCGGAGGLAGRGGGSSIGIASLTTVLHLTGVAITVGVGGKGGAGGLAEGGAGGGSGGITGGCPGGGGGSGAGGGGGGGGAGGMSAGVVRKSGSLDGVPNVQKGTLGVGGLAGGFGTGGTNIFSTAPSGGAGTPGLDGVSEDVVDVN